MPALTPRSPPSDLHVDAVFAAGHGIHDHAPADATAIHVAVYDWYRDPREDRR